MKTIASLASAGALAAFSLAAHAWWGVPYGPCGTTEEQQRSMTEQQAKAMEQMMAYQRQMAEQMAPQMAPWGADERRGGGPSDPFAMGYPGGMGPWGNMDMPEFPAMGDMPSFGPMSSLPPLPDMPGFGPYGRTHDFPSFDSPYGQAPEMPDMPAFGGMPEYPGFPEVPEPDLGYLPQPSLPPFMQGRYAAIEAHRAKVLEEAQARREKAAERRREIEANRFARPHRYPGMGGTRPYAGMTPETGAPASSPSAAPA